jgi:hypothetical protein
VPDGTEGATFNVSVELPEPGALMDAGLKLALSVRGPEISVVPASVTVYAKAVGVEPIKGAAYWQLQIVNTTLSLPAWFPFVLLLPALAMAIIAPVTILVSMVLAAALEGVVQGELQVIAGDIMNQGQIALDKATIPSLQTVNL